MNDPKKQSKKPSVKRDIMNTIAGIALIVFIVLIFVFPNNPYAILAACITGGLMNIMNGLKQRRGPNGNSMGTALIVMGAIVIFLGLVIFGID